MLQTLKTVSVVYWMVVVSERQFPMLTAVQSLIAVLNIKWRVKAEDRQEWSRIVEQTKTHPGL
jgi:hypothetical protein